VKQLYAPIDPEDFIWSGSGLIRSDLDSPEAIHGENRFRAKFCEQYEDYLEAQVQFAARIVIPIQFSVSGVQECGRPPGTAAPVQCGEDESAPGEHEDEFGQE
jgi:hypothetical protein